MVVLDIGSGHNPQPGCIHLDIRPGLPDLDVVCDFSKERLPFDDGSVDGVISNHSIEHISWTKVGFLVSEWIRVLKPGGWAKIRTPDLKFICTNYLAGKTTKEWPEDEAMATQIFGSCESSEIALIKLFSGQEVESNVHFACYDFSMLSKLLKKHGFSDVSPSQFETEFSPGELQVTAIK